MTQTPPKPNHLQNGAAPHSRHLSQAKAAPLPPQVPPPPPPSRNPQPRAQERAATLALAPETTTEMASKRQLFNLTQWWQGLRLRSKTTVIAVALGTLPVLAVGGAAYTLTQRSTYLDKANQEVGTAVALQDKVNAFMFERYGDIQVLANQEVFVDPKLRATHNFQQKSEVLEKYKQSYGGVYDSIAVFDLQGNPIAQTAEGGKLGNHLNRSYVQEALKTNGRVVSQPSISTSSGTYAIYTAAPIKDELTGQTIAIVRARIPVKVLGQLLAPYTKDQTDYYLTNAAGEIFLGSKGIYVNSTNSNGQTVEGAGSAGEYTAVSATTIFPEFTEAFQGNQALAQVTHNAETDQRQMVAFGPPITYQNLPPLNWGAMAAQDTNLAFAKQRRLLLALLLGTGASILAATTVAFWIARRLTQPLESASQAVGQIGQGDLSTRLPVEGEDELAELALNINQMASQLEQYTQEQQFASRQSGLLASVTSISMDLAPEKRSQLLDQILTQARQFLGVNRLVIYGLRENGNGAVQHEALEPGAGYPSALQEAFEDPCIPKELLEAYRHNRVVVNPDTSQGTLHPEHRLLLDRLRIKAFVIVPIVNQDRLFGLLIAHHCDQVHAWEAAEVNFLKQLSQQISVLMIVQAFATLAEEQRQIKETLQRRALELMIQVDPVSQGDLTVRAQVTEDEIGTIADSYNATIESLRRIVSQVQTAATDMAATANTNEALVQTLSTGAEQQSTEIAAAMARIQEMVSSIRAVVANAEQAEKAAQASANTVQAGDEAMNRTVEGILTIRETVAETAKKVKRLGESSQRISKVVNLIGDFASQTNLLALNASIEAARAGEEGRGFAVVADEVRSLARQSAAATAEIEALVAEIQAETNEVVTAMEKGTEQVVSGTQLVNETRQSLNQINQASQQINHLVGAITQAAMVQATDSEAVTQTMQDVAAIAQRTTEEADLVSASFKQLLSVAQVLQNSMGQFKVS